MGFHTYNERNAFRELAPVKSKNKKEITMKAMQLNLAKIVLVSVAMLVACTEARAQSVLDGFDPNANGPIFKKEIVVQSDGKVVVGGDFTTLSPNGGATVTRNRIARLNADGTLDMAFNPDANNTVNTVALQADGKILVGGFFTNIGGQPRNRIARLDPVTGLADSFNPNADSLVQSIVVQPDGKLLVGGFFTSIGGQPRNYIARLDPITGQADTFNPNANTAVTAIALQADGKILVCGAFEIIGGQPRRYMARLDPVTGLADSFDPNPSYLVDAITVQPDGKILVAGQFSTNNSGTIGGQPRNRIARLDPVTGLADSFDPNANCDVNAIALQADGKILAGGCFNSVGGQPRNRIARLDPTTGLSDSFNPNANNAVESITVQPDGNILIGGGFLILAPNGGTPVIRNRIARLSANGWPTPTPTATPTATATATATPPIPSPTPTATPPVTPTPSPVPGGGGINLSTRGYVQTGDRVMIAGFIQGRNEVMTIAVRGIGPSMGNIGVVDFLADPVLVLVNASGQEIMRNDDWQDDPTQASQIIAAGLAPSDSRESALIINLSTGSYTAILSGKNSGIGTALVEFYVLH